MLTFFKRFLILAIHFISADKELNMVLGKSTKFVDVSSIIKQSKTIQIKNANILPEDCSTFIKNQDVILKDGVITQIDKSQLQHSGKVVIDGTNKFLLPGLDDSHETNIYN